MRCYHCTRSIKHTWQYLFRDLYIAAESYLSNTHTRTVSFSLALHSTFRISIKVVTAGAMWHYCYLSPSFVYTIQQCTSLQRHFICSPCVFSCNLPPALLAEWPGSFMSSKWVSTESWFWGEEFCCYSCWAHVCLTVTCHLHFWQNGRDLLCTTAVTQGQNGYQMSQHRKLLHLLRLKPQRSISFFF